MSQCASCGAALEPSHAARFGAACPDCVLKFAAADEGQPEFPNLQILGVLGRGGMGVVYDAVQPLLGRQVALKILSPHLGFDAKAVARFQDEARTLARLQHPNIVTVHDVGLHGGLHYIVLEHVDGATLRAQLKRGPIPPRRAIEIARAVCDALAWAHARGVIHRDVKPENVLIDGAGRVKVADFGLARLPERKAAVGKLRLGTRRYMAPEQRRNPETVDARADLYAVGRVLAEMLTGKPGLPRRLPPAAPPALLPLLKRLLQRDPAKRPAGAAEVRDLLSSQN